MLIFTLLKTLICILLIVVSSGISTSLKAELLNSELINDSVQIGLADTIPIRLAGVIYSDDTTLNKAYVHVINKRTGRGTITDSIGLFKTTLLKSDTLIFRAIGFEDKYLHLSDTVNSTVLFLEIKLEEKSYFLDVIDVLALTRINQFKYDFINIPLPKNKWNDQMIIPGVSRSKYQWIKEDERYIPQETFDGPISSIYKAFSDKEASIRKYLELINNEEGDKLIAEKFNMDLLAEYTGFTGDTLIDFKLFLNFSRSYLLKTDGYHILLNVKNQLPKFKQQYLSDTE